MAKYKILLTETMAGDLEVEAESRGEAYDKAQRMIDGNDVPDGIMNESSGYRIEDIQKIKD